MGKNKTVANLIQNAAHCPCQIIYLEQTWVSLILFHFFKSLTGSQISSANFRLHIQLKLASEYLRLCECLPVLHLQECACTTWRKLYLYPASICHVQLRPSLLCGWNNETQQPINKDYFLLTSGGRCFTVRRMWQSVVKATCANIRKNK